MKEVSGPTLPGQSPAVYQSARAARAPGPSGAPTGLLPVLERAEWNDRCYEQRPFATAPSYFGSPRHRERTPRCHARRTRRGRQTGELAARAVPLPRPASRCWMAVLNPGSGLRQQLGERLVVRGDVFVLLRPRDLLARPARRSSAVTWSAACRTASRACEVRNLRFLQALQSFGDSSLHEPFIRLVNLGRNFGDLL